jgi:hypothetical protein
MNKENIDIVKNKYEKIKKDFYSNNSITKIKKYIEHTDNDYEKYFIIKEIINTICSFEKNIINIDYIVNKIYILYQDKDDNFIILYKQLNNFFPEFQILYMSIDLQIKNIINKFNM